MEPIFFDFEFNGKTKSICLVDLPKTRSIDLFADHLHSNYSTRIEHIDLVILRTNTNIPIDELKNAKQDFGRLIRKIPNAAIRILHTNKDFDHLLTFDLASECPEYPPECFKKLLLVQAREKELKYYAEEYGAVLSAREGFVYQTPSGICTNKFLRVGNIQKNRQVLDAIYFWMLPHLKSCVAIVTDTWSISSIALNAARLLERHHTEERHHTDFRCGIEMFSEYIADIHDHHHQSIIDNLKTHISTNKKCKILVLFSVVHSGKSLSVSQQILESIPNNNVAILAIYSLSDNDNIDSLCSSIEDFKVVDQGQNVVIKIDPSSYFPTIVSDKPLNIRKPNSSPNKDFFDSYKGLKAIRIHRNVYDLNGRELRHHAFYIEVESLLDDSGFQIKFSNILKDFKKISVVVVPSHSAGKRLGEEACNIFAKNRGSTPDLIVHDNLRPDELCEMNKEYFRNLNKQSEILILDDVSTTGERLNTYQKSIRELNYPGRIFYLVCVARPDNQMTWLDRIDKLRFRDNGEHHSVKFVEQIVLPNWSRNNCPWCLEYEWLNDLKERKNLQSNCADLVLNRRLLLEEVADNKGLINDVLWIPNLERPKLTKGSIFIDHEKTSEADVIAAVAGAIQNMRYNTDEECRLINNFQQPRVLSPENYSGPEPRFNDQILQLAVLRSTLPKELRRWDADDEKHRNEHLQMMVEKNKNLILEFAIAVSQHKASIDRDILENWQDLEFIELLT